MKLAHQIRVVAERNRELHKQVEALQEQTDRNRLLSAKVQAALNTWAQQLPPEFVKELHDSIDEFL